MTTGNIVYYVTPLKVGDIISCLFTLIDNNFSFNDILRKVTCVNKLSRHNNVFLQK